MLEDVMKAYKNNEYKINYVRDLMNDIGSRVEYIYPTTDEVYERASLSDFWNLVSSIDIEETSILYRSQMQNTMRKILHGRRRQMAKANQSSRYYTGDVLCLLTVGDRTTMGIARKRSGEVFKKSEGKELAIIDAMRLLYDKLHGIDTSEAIVPVIKREVITVSPAILEKYSVSVQEVRG